DRSFGNAYGNDPNNILSYGYSFLNRDVGQGIVQRIQQSEYATLQADGKILAGGIYAVPNESPYRAGTTRRQNTFRSGVYNDFNNDGRAELATFSNGNWQWLDSFDKTKTTTVQLGTATDQLAPADYDGDGRTDPAIFRDGTWSIKQSSNNLDRAAQFGQAGDIPRPGDFNGDGLADFAVFRPSNATWYVLLSNPIQPGNVTQLTQQFGTSNDSPVLGDFDGDGKTDFAVFRAGAWSYLRSTDGQTVTTQLGQAGDIPVAGDYDGDSRTDQAVFRPSSGLWLIRRSTDAQTTQTQFGQAGDTPAPGDYDNDGKNDLAVFRGGAWVVQRSSDSQTSSSSFGQASGRPVASAYTSAGAVSFSAAGFTVNEGDGFATITVTRAGDTLTAAAVNFATSDGTASQSKNYTTSSGTLTFAPGETSKTFAVVITDNAYVEGNKTVNLALSSPSGATFGAPSTAVLTIVDNDTQPPTTNPVDDARAFVRQQYADFLNRAPDQGGLDYWSSQITQCGTDQACVRARRIAVSNAFFFELEYQQTGAYVFRLYRAAFGNTQPFPNPDSANPQVSAADQAEARKIPSYAVFSQDRAKVVGGTSLAQSQLDLANQFAQRAEFLAKYPATLTGAQFVDSLLANIKADIGVDLSSQRDALISLFNSGGRGAVLYRVADDNAQSNPVNNKAFIDAEYNRA
ncbi:MAG TPA: FG-GAP-like repeat-containing protein, partial [Pyrinomonadaceae bacterium]